MCQEGRKGGREGGKRKRKGKGKKEKELKGKIVLPPVPKKNRLSGLIDIFLLTNISDLQNTAELPTLYFNNFQGFFTKSSYRQNYERVVRVILNVSEYLCFIMYMYPRLQDYDVI